MAIPKSEKLQAESDAGVTGLLQCPDVYKDMAVPTQHGDDRKIKRLYPLNDMVAMWVEPSASTIVITDKDRYKHEGVIVGVGPNVDQVKIGDLVAFQDKTPYSVISGSGMYENERIILMSERFLLMKLKSITFTLVD
jgi:hypothetical protein